jgi:hypothetical protein
MEFGYDSAYISETLGSIFVIIVFTLVGIFLVIFGYFFEWFSPNTKCGNYLRAKH